MAEQLTQAQIDALLGRLSAGEDNPVPDDKKIKKYDFHSPKKFTKEQLKAMDGLHENFARMLSSYLTGVLRIFCEVSVASIEEQRYFEYNNALPDNSLIALLDFKPHNKRYSDGILLADVSTSLGFFMVDRFLGGPGEDYNQSRDYTDIEIALLRHAMEQMIKRLQDAWINYLEIDLTLSSIETNARLLQALAPDDIVVLIMLNVKVKGLSGTINLCIPADNLEEVIGHFSMKYTRSTKRQAHDNEELRHKIIFDSLLDSDLEVKAVMSRTQLTLKDILQLQVSDIIPLDKSINSDIMVAVDDVPWYSAKLGEVKLKKAIRLDAILS